jgi:hypothetical protein
LLYTDGIALLLKFLYMFFTKVRQNLVEFGLHFIYFIFFLLLFLLLFKLL